MNAVMESPILQLQKNKVVQKQHKYDPKVHKLKGLTLNTLWHPTEDAILSTHFNLILVNRSDVSSPLPFSRTSISGSIYVNEHKKITQALTSHLHSLENFYLPEYYKNIERLPNTEEFRSLKEKYNQENKDTHLFPLFPSFYVNFLDTTQTSFELFNEKEHVTLNSRVAFLHSALMVLAKKQQSKDTDFAIQRFDLHVGKQQDRFSFSRINKKIQDVLVLPFPSSIYQWHVHPYIMKKSIESKKSSKATKQL